MATSCSACSTFTAERSTKRPNPFLNILAATLTTHLVGTSCQNGCIRWDAPLQAILPCPLPGDCILFAELIPRAPSPPPMRLDSPVYPVCKRSWLHASRTAISFCYLDMLACYSAASGFGGSPGQTGASHGPFLSEIFLLPNAS